MAVFFCKKLQRFCQAGGVKDAKHSALSLEEYDRQASAPCNGGARQIGAGEACRGGKKFAPGLQGVCGVDPDQLLDRMKQPERC